MKRHEPIFFKVRPKQIGCLADAEFIRDLGRLGIKGEAICEIARFPSGEKWIVRCSEIKSQKEAIDEIYHGWEDEILAAQQPDQKKKDLADKLGISPATLRRRVKLIEKWNWKA